MGKFINRALDIIASPLTLIDRDLGRAVSSIGFIAIGVATGNPYLVSAGLARGSSLLAPKAKPPAFNAAAFDRLTASINPRAPRVMAFGSTALATDVRDQEYTDSQTYLHRFLVVASHRCQAIREIWFDDQLAWSTTGGVQAAYANYLTVTPVLEGSAGNAINISARMGSSRRFTGCAYVHLRYRLTGINSKATSPFASSIPSRVTIVGDGIALYDPRLDSTVPGGSGPQRASDQSTWTWNASSALNPALQAVTYLLGWRINGKLAVGKGLPPARIDLASFAVAANHCDEPVTRPDSTSEPRYRAAGLIGEDMALDAALGQFRAAMNADIDDADGRMRCIVFHNDLAVPVGDLFTDDVLGAFKWLQTPALDQRINIVRGSYVDPSTASLFQAIDYPEVAIASPDGIDRPLQANLSLVQWPGQAQRLGKLRLGRAQFGGVFEATFQATAWRYQKGDVVRFTFRPLGWSQKLFRVAEISTQVNGQVPMVLREENPAIYAAYSNEAAAIAGAAPTAYDPQLWPLVQGIVDGEAQIARIFSDGVITHGREKRELVQQWAALEAEFQALDARYAALGSPSDITGARGEAFTAYQQLAAFLAALTPPWDQIATDTPVDAATFDQRWRAARAKVEAFAAAITGRKGDNGTNGTDGANAATITVSASPIGIRYTASGQIASGPVTFTAVRQNVSGPINWASTLGHAIYNQAGVTFDGDTMTWSQARIFDVLAYNQDVIGTLSETVVASVGSAQGRASITKVRDGATGGSAFTLSDYSNLPVIAPNALRKVGGSGNAWNGKAYTQEGSRTVSVSALLVQGSFVGLDSYPSETVDYTSIDYAFHWSTDGSISIWSKGSRLAEVGAAPASDGPFPVRLDSDGSVVRLFFNGAEKLVNGAPLPQSITGSAPLYATFAAAPEGTTIGGITFAVNGQAGVSPPLILLTSDLTKFPYANGAPKPQTARLAAQVRNAAGAQIEWRLRSSKGQLLFDWRTADLISGTGFGTHQDYYTVGVSQSQFNTAVAQDGSTAVTFEVRLQAEHSTVASLDLVRIDDGATGATGATADDLGLGLRSSGSGVVNVPSAGNTVFTLRSDAVTLPAGRKLCLTLGGRDASYVSGGAVSAAQITVTLSYGGNSSTLFTGVVLVDTDGAIDTSKLEAAGARTFDNPASGAATVTITYQRVGAINNASTFTLDYQLERL